MGFLTGVRRQKQAWGNKAPKPTQETPDLLARQRVSGYGGTQAADVQDGYAGYAAVYRSYTWVRRAIDVTANNVVSLPVRVVDANDKPLDNHPVSLLLARGNDQMTPATIWQHWLTNMYLGGEGPLEIVDDLRGNPLWLWPRRPDLVLIRADVTPERANYPTVAGYVVMPEQAPGASTAPIDVPPGNMIFDKFLNPLNTWRGLAPITALRASIIIDVFAQAWAKSFLQRGARPDYALVAPQGITQTEKERILSELMFSYSGAENWHKPIVLEEGITDIKTFSFPPSDMEWVEQRQFTQNEVGALFGVPDEIMGYGKDTYENFQTALRVFWTLTLRPLCEHRDQALTHHFTTKRSLLAPGERVATDYTGVGVLQEDKAPKVDMAVKLWSIGVPFNQLDAQLGLGIGPIEGGEFPNGTDPAVAQAMAALAAQGAQDGQGGAQDDGDGLDAENAQEDEQEAQQGGKTALPFRWNGITIPDAYKALQLIHDPGDENTPEEVLLRALEESAQREIARELRRIYRDLLPPNAESMTLYELQTYIEQRIGSQALNDAIDATVRRAADAGVTIAADQLATMGVGFDYTMVHTAARDWARAYSAELIKGVNDTTKAAVRESVARWYDNGEHLDALTKDLAPTFGNTRARMIAQTETTKAAARGTLASYEASGVVTAMVWLTAADEKRCGYCKDLDGKTVSLSGNFSDVLSPELRAKLKNRTFQTPPAHVSCRCRIGAQVIEIGGGNG